MQGTNKHFIACVNQCQSKSSEKQIELKTKKCRFRNWNSIHDIEFLTCLYLLALIRSGTTDHEAGHRLLDCGKFLFFLFREKTQSSKTKFSFENVEIGVESALREEKMSSTVGVYKTLVGRERGHTHTHKHVVMLRVAFSNATAAIIHRPL
jgi:hypothetical protein